MNQQSDISALRQSIIDDMPNIIAEREQCNEFEATRLLPRIAAMTNGVWKSAATVRKELCKFGIFLTIERVERIMCESGMQVQ